MGSVMGSGMFGVCSGGEVEQVGGILCVGGGIVILRYRWEGAFGTNL